MSLLDYSHGVQDVLNELLGKKAKVVVHESGEFDIILGETYYRDAIELNVWHCSPMTINGKKYTAEEAYCIRNDWVKEKRCKNLEELMEFIKASFVMGNTSMSI